MTPDSVNPVPDRLAPVTETAPVPVEDNVIDCVEGTPTATFPNVTLLAFTASVGVPPLPATWGLNLMAKVSLTPAAVEVSIAVSAALTVAIVAVNATVDAFAGTVTRAGTVTAVLLLDRVTETPLLGAVVDKVTVQESVAAPLTAPLVQERALSVADPVPEVPVVDLPLTVRPPQPASVKQLPRANMARSADVSPALGEILKGWALGRAVWMLHEFGPLRVGTRKK